MSAENCLFYDTIHDISVWMRTGSNPADINRFRSDTGNRFIPVRQKICWFVQRKIFPDSPVHLFQKSQLGIHYNITYINHYTKVTEYLSVPNDPANHWTDMVLLYRFLTIWEEKFVLEKNDPPISLFSFSL